MATTTVVWRIVDCDLFSQRGWIGNREGKSRHHPEKIWEQEDEQEEADQQPSGGRLNIQSVLYNETCYLRIDKTRICSPLELLCYFLKKKLKNIHILKWIWCVIYIRCQPVQDEEVRRRRHQKLQLVPYLTRSFDSPLTHFFNLCFFFLLHQMLTYSIIIREPLVWTWVGTPLPCAAHHIRNTWAVSSPCPCTLLLKLTFLLGFTLQARSRTTGETILLLPHLWFCSSQGSN